MSDLTERLRELAETAPDPRPMSAVMLEAKAELERLEREVAELREAGGEAAEALNRLLDYALFHDSSLVEHEEEAKQSPIVTASKRAITKLDKALSTTSGEG